MHHALPTRTRFPLTTYSAGPWDQSSIFLFHADREIFDDCLERGGHGTGLTSGTVHSGVSNTGNSAHTGSCSAEPVTLLFATKTKTFFLSQVGIYISTYWFETGKLDNGSLVYRQPEQASEARFYVSLLRIRGWRA